MKRIKEAKNRVFSSAICFCVRQKRKVNGGPIREVFWSIDGDKSFYQMKVKIKINSCLKITAVI